MIKFYLIMSFVLRYERIFTMILLLSLSNLLLAFNLTIKLLECLGDGLAVDAGDFRGDIGGSPFKWFSPLVSQKSGDPRVPLSSEELDEGVKLGPDES
jgi:hypothetical protein